MSRQLPLLLAVVTLLLLGVCAVGRAQGIDCNVSVNYEQVVGSNKDLLQGLAADLRDYINNYQWGAENVPDKIPCTLQVFVQGVTGPDKYIAQVFIGSQRPVFKSGKSTAVVRLKDDAWEFTYIKGRPISHSPYTYNDLTSFLDFYMNLVLGFDGDTYDRLGGTPYFQRALEIMSRGRSSGDKGWTPATTGYSRSQYLDELMLPKVEPVRVASFMYHFNGLDSMAINPARGQANVLQALDMIGRVRNDVGQRSLVVKSFFDTKYMEIAEVFSTYPDKSVYQRLSAIDPSHQQTYVEYQNRP